MADVKGIDTRSPAAMRRASRAKVKGMAATDGFLPVETYSNWCELDQVGLKNCVDGQPVIVLWPDGGEERTELIVKASVQTVSDMGTPYDCPVSKVFVRVWHKGAEMLVRLAGTGAKVKVLDWGVG